MEWLGSIWESLSWDRVAIGAAMFVVSLAFSFAAIGIVMVKVPERYFASDFERTFLPESKWMVRWGALLVKNVAGVLLIALGVILSLPGVPGQGILTILLGLIFLDIPGKRPLEARIIRRPALLSAINKLRARYDKPPLVVD